MPWVAQGFRQPTAGEAANSIVTRDENTVAWEILRGLMRTIEQQQQFKHA